MSNKKYKILLATVYNTTSEVMFEEMGICYLAAWLRERDYEVKLVCAREHQIDYDEIIEFAPDMVGVTAYYYTKNTVYRFCERMKEDMPDVYVCVGGYLPTYFSERILEECAAADFVIRGEGEISFTNLINHLEDGRELTDVKGLVYRDGEAIMVNEDEHLVPDMDDLPYPVRDVLIQNNLRVASVTTSRGCVRRCRFCSTAKFWKKWRGRSLESILGELRAVYDMGIRYFSFNDSSFEDYHIDEERLLEIARGIQGLNLDISYISGFRAEFHKRATPELMETLRDSGLRQVRIGIEMGNESDRKVYGKYASVEDNYKVIKLFDKYQIYVRVGFINFNPYSSFETLQQNIEFLDNLKWASNFFLLSSRLTVYKGTRIFNKVKNDGLMVREESDTPGYVFVDPRLMEMSNFVQGYVYMANTGTDGALTKICNFKNYFQSVIYDFLVRFREHAGDDASKVVLNFEKDIRDILDDVNNRNVNWFSGLLDLAGTGWNNPDAVDVMENHLHNSYLMDTVSLLEGKKKAFGDDLRQVGPQYVDWMDNTFKTVGSLII